MVAIAIGTKFDLPIIVNINVVFIFNNDNTSLCYGVLIKTQKYNNFTIDIYQE